MRSKKIIIAILLIMICSFILTTKSFAGITPDMVTGQGGELDISIIDKIVGIVRVVGIFTAVGIMMVVGIKYMAGTIEEKANYKKTMMPYVIGCFLLFGASIFAPTIMKLFSNLGNDAQSIGNGILGIIRVVGSYVAVAIVMMVGVKYMMGSTENRAEYKKTMIPYFTGAILLFAAVNLSSVIYEVIPKDDNLDLSDLMKIKVDAATKSATVSWSEVEGATEYGVELYTGSGDIATMQDILNEGDYKIASLSYSGSILGDSFDTMSAQSGEIEKLSDRTYKIAEDNTSGQWKRVKTVQNTSTTIQELKEGTTYKTRVVPYINNEAGEVSREVEFKTNELPESYDIKDLVAMPDKTSVYVSWGGAESAKEYIVEIYKDGKWTEVDKCTNKYKMISNLSMGTEYKVRVKGLNGSKSGSYSSAISFTTKREDVNKVMADGLRKDTMNPTDMAHNTEYLQKLVNDASNAGGGTVQLPAGDYYFSAQKNEQKDEDDKKYGEEYVIKCRNNVTIIGAGQGPGDAGTTLWPTGNTSIDMFFFNDYAASGFKNKTFLDNADFQNFVIDGVQAAATSYSSAGKGFMINLMENCDWYNVTVRNTDGTGFGMDCPRNCTIRNCTAIGNGKGGKYSSKLKQGIDYVYGASGFGIGTGFANDENIIMENCISQANFKYGYFFEHQNRFRTAEQSSWYPADNAKGFIVRNCTAQENTYDFGGAKANDVTYENCKSLSNNSNMNKLAFYFELLSIRINIKNCTVSQQFSDIRTGENKETLGEGEYKVVSASNNLSKSYVTKLSDVTPIDTNYGVIIPEMGTFKNYSTKTIAESDYQKEQYNAVSWALSNGIINGMNKTTFGPNEKCTQMHAVDVLYRLAGRPGAVISPADDAAYKNGKKYADYTSPKIVYGGRYDVKSIRWALHWWGNEPLISKDFDPELDYCTRAKFVWMLWKVAGKPNVTITHEFTDVEKGSEYEKAINWAYRESITVRCRKL